MIRNDRSRVSRLTRKGFSVVDGGDAGSRGDRGAKAIPVVDAVGGGLRPARWAIWSVWPPLILSDRLQRRPRALGEPGTTGVPQRLQAVYPGVGLPACCSPRCGS